MCPCCFSTSPAGPAAHWWALKPSVPVGYETAGPKPSTNPSVFGEKKKVCRVSPNPIWSPRPGADSPCEITGTMVRMIRFQSSVRCRGTTG